MAEVQVLKHQYVIHSHRLAASGRYSVGRNPNSDIIVGDEENSEVSFDHAVITMSEEVKIGSRKVNGAIGTVRDHSRLGTYLNRFLIGQNTPSNPGIPLEVPLFEGDTLALGKAGYSIQFIKPNATLQNPYPEIEQRDGSYYLRGSILDDNRLGASEKRLLTEFFSASDGILTCEEIYMKCHVRDREEDPDSEPGSERRYSQRLVSELRGFFRERDRYSNFLFRHLNGSYSMRRPEILVD